MRFFIPALLFCLPFSVMAQITDLSTVNPSPLIDLAVEEDNEQEKEKAHRYQSIGLGVDVVNGKDTYVRTVFIGGDKVRLNREELVQLPQLSLIYERQLLRSMPHLFGELQVRAFRRQESGTYDFYQFGERDTLTLGPNEFIESVDLLNLYFYPGLNYHFGKSRDILMFVGAGAAIAYPINFDRSLEFRSTNFPEFPMTQTLADIQDPSVGYYVQLGAQLHFPGGLSFGMVLRQEELEQVWNDVSQEDVLNSELFIIKDEVALQRQFMFQCQLLYSW